MHHTRLMCETHPLNHTGASTTLDERHYINDILD